MGKTRPEPAETETEPRQPGPPPKSNDRKPGRPPKDHPASENSHSFFQTLSRVDRDDWGTRINLYLYRTEPTIDRTRQGDPKYIMTYGEPINEDRILADHGSGRYKMILNFRKPGAERGDEIDTGYISLLNMNFPPRIPPGDWVDDPHNKKWAWAKKHFPPENNGAAIAADPFKALETVSRIRKEVADELRPAPSDSPEERMLMLATVLEKLSPKPSNPDEFMKNIGTLMAQLRPPEDKMSAFMLEQYSDLLKEVLKTRKEDTTERPNSLTVVKEVITGFKELVPQFRELIPGVAEGTTTRSRMTSWQEFAVAMSPTLSAVLAPLAAVLAQTLTRVGQNPAPGAAPPPLALPPPQGNAGAPGAGNPPPLMPFLNIIANPMMNYAREMAAPINADPVEAGEDFAAWVHEGFGANANYHEAIATARLMGPLGVIAAFRVTPYWNDRGTNGQAPSLSSLETQLYPFYNAFLNWTPRPDEDQEGDDDDEPLTIHTASEAPEAPAA